MIDMLVGDIYGGMDYSKVNIFHRQVFALISVSESLLVFVLQVEILMEIGLI